MTIEKTISAGGTPYRSFVYNKKGEGKLVETIEERDALYSTGEWFDSPEVAKEQLKAEIKLTEDKLKVTDADIEKQVTEHPNELKPDNEAVNAIKQAVNSGVAKVHVEEHEAKDKKHDKHDKKGK